MAERPAKRSWQIRGRSNDRGRPRASVFRHGLFQLGSPKAETAAGGRNLLSQVKDTGKVTFVPDEMWALFLDACVLPS